MSEVTSDHLLFAVSELCWDIVDRTQKPEIALSEDGLWHHLLTCLLSSQVPYDLAVAAADSIADHRFLDGPEAGLAHEVDRLTNILSQPFNVQGRSRRYRFPNVKARQIVETRCAVSEAAGSLSELVGTFEDCELARDWFIRHAPGMGPKQTSMFLRDVGLTNDLAILDRHVIRYMRAVGLWNSSSEVITGLKEYVRHEAVLKDHAEELGHPVGIVDGAIWIVMRVSKQRKLEFFL